jgi:N-acetylgalactosamine-N,N'-diacetylbacillosaminyl-diphospho-undecaprenol 4-alpha-N-acetylgalactosaminyltransferase
MRQLRALVRREQPDLIVSFLTRSNMATTIIAQMFGVPNVTSERANTSGQFAPGLKGILPKRLISAIYPRASKVIAVSEGIVADLVENFGVQPQNVVAIPNPLNVKSVRGAATQEVTLPVAGPFGIVVSRLTRSKNVVTAVEAFAGSGLDHSLVILGEGPERAAIEACAAALG